MTSEHEKETMKTEIARVQNLLAEAIDQIESEGGSIRFFNASLMSAAMVLHAQVEGPETVDAALSKHAQRVMVTNGQGSRC